MKIVLMVLAALFLLLLCPVRLQLHWKEELSATARWLFLRFPLLPRSKPKKEQPEKTSARWGGSLRSAPVGRALCAHEKSAPSDAGASLRAGG